MLAARHEAYLLDSSEVQAIALVVNYLRMTTATPDVASGIIRRRRAFLTGLERMGRLHRVAGKALLEVSASLAVEHDLAFVEALPVAQALVSQSVLVFTEPHLALPFERMQATIPQFQFELLG